MQYGYFQQNSVTPPTAQANLNYLREFYGGALMSSNRWPAHSQDLTSLDFFLFGQLKNKFYAKALCKRFRKFYYAISKKK